VSSFGQKGALSRQPLARLVAAIEPVKRTSNVEELREDPAFECILKTINGDESDCPMSNWLYWTKSTPHQSRTWEAGNQVMLWADCKVKGWSKKLSKKWMVPHTIIAALKCWFSRSQTVGTSSLIKVEQIKPFNAATRTILNSSSNEGHYKAEESTMDTSRYEYKVNWVGYTNHNSWVTEED